MPQADPATAVRALYGHVLVPLDGSPAAERALDYAKRIVRNSGGRLTLVQAVHPRAVAGTDAAQMQIDGVRAAELGLAEHVAKLREEGFAADRRVDYGQPGSIILRAIDEANADLVVMSTHGRSGLGRVVYGTVADHVLRRSEVPVLLIPLNCERTWTAETANRILVPLDGSALAEEALPAAADLARCLSASITLLQVIRPLPPPGPYDVMGVAFDPEAALSEARNYLTTAQASLGATGLTIGQVAVLGQPAAMICSEAEHERAAAIVMATHGRSGLARLVLGSVATSVLQACRRPVLLVCPPAISRHPSRLHSGQASKA